MSSVTALQLVNRVRLFRRQPTTTDIATPEDEVTLNAINMAKEDVLSTRKWEWDLRHDGALTLKAKQTNFQMIGSAGSTSVSIRIDSGSGMVDSDLYGNYVTSVVVDGSSLVPNTAYRIEKGESVLTGNLANVTLGAPLPESTSLTSATLVYLSYILPDKVREVVRVSHQEQELDLFMADPVMRYDELFPNPSSTDGEPLKVAVGGYDVSTWNETTGTEPEPGLRFAVWPTPDVDYTLKYSYYVRHPELTTATSTLDGVPESVVNDIVLQATSIVKMMWDENFAAAHFTDLSRQNSAAKHSMGGASSGRRRTIHSHDSGVGRFTVDPAFGGKLIGQN